MTAAHKEARAHARLVERDLELVAVESVIGATRGGRLLAIEGAPGIGKTALMAETKALGREAEMEVLGGRGSELERSFSYGVVRQLFEPFLASVPAISSRSQLAAALAEPVPA